MQNNITLTLSLVIGPSSLVSSSGLDPSTFILVLSFYLLNLSCPPWMSPSCCTTTLRSSWGTMDCLLNLHPLFLKVFHPASFGIGLSTSNWNNSDQTYEWTYIYFQDGGSGAGSHSVSLCLYIEENHATYLNGLCKAIFYCWLCL